ncbi:hypothetical protein D9756_005841 [Leucocoprinus leucothites]|uniref:Het-C-domain-containing protein n=1 Tax=Leucocoprinus leucothites TaxID=201217 RepID=A0A8H5FXD4_9AGAR|nr:hypothetical protein D9756_005841 [Leucoagaricus leucothites]
MPTTLTTFLLIATVFLVLSPTGALAFGAGDIPDFAYLNDKAFRHGDIEGILENLVKNAGGAALGGGGLLGFASSVISAASGGLKFSKMDVKRVYFGNWLRDYSQAMDIAGLSKLAPDSITLIISVLGFMTFGFATREFEVTQERLGVYLPVEHIDNPKGYAEAEGDARRIHPKLRPPVERRELEIDEQTGMKRYMASENEGFDTSTACIRRTLKACIEHGRRAGGEDNADQFEAFRLLGTGLHTLEDLLAHSNWCEIALRKMGYDEVFCHIGDNVIVDTPNGPAPPLVTGTFGGADFLHSLLGEAGDHLSQASVTDLAGKMDQASLGGDSNMEAFKAVLGKLPIGGGDEKLNQGQQMHEQAKAYHFDPNNIAPPEVQRQLLDLLKWRDGVMRDITETIEKIPGLSDLVEQFENALNAFVYTVLAPYLTPMITSVTDVLSEGSKAVINSEDQYQVFDDPDASDPSHSILSKARRNAGKIAQVVVEYAVNLIVKAWSDDSDPDRVLDTVLEAFHHPYYATGQSQIQHLMFEHMEKWIGGLGSDEAQEIIQRLTKESVREHKNKRIGSEDMNLEEPGYSHKPQNYSQGNQYSSGGSAYASGGHTSGGGRHGGSGDQSYGSSYGQEQSSFGGGEYGRQESEYGRSRRDEDSHGGGYQQEDSRYNVGYSQDSYGSRRENNEGYGGGGHGQASYGISRRDEDNNSYGRSDEYPRRDNDEYASSRRNEGGYGQRQNHENDNSYGRSDESSRRDNEGYTPSHGQSEYGSRRREDESYGHTEEYSGRGEGYGSGGGGYGGGGYGGGGYSGGGGHGDRSEGYGRDEGYGRSEGYGGRSEVSGGDSYGGRSGYNPSYGGDDTFGAERLNIRDDEEEYGERKHHHHHHHHHDDE